MTNLLQQLILCAEDEFTAYLLLVGIIATGIIMTFGIIAAGLNCLEEWLNK